MPYYVSLEFFALTKVLYAINRESLALHKCCCVARPAYNPHKSSTDAERLDIFSKDVKRQQWGEAVRVSVRADLETSDDAFLVETRERSFATLTDVVKEVLESRGEIDPRRLVVAVAGCWRLRVINPATA